MTRGNQRDLARAKNQKKQADLKKKNNDKDGLTLEQRIYRLLRLLRGNDITLYSKQWKLLRLLKNDHFIFQCFRDAELMREKQKKKEEDEAAAKKASTKS